MFDVFHAKHDSPVLKLNETVTIARTDVRQYNVPLPNRALTASAARGTTATAALAVAELHPRTVAIFEIPKHKEESSSETESADSTIDSVTSRQTDWKSIRLMMIIILLTRIQFTVYFASLWPFLQEVDETATMHDYAVISAVYSIGIAGSAPFFGYWSNKLGCIRIPSMCSMVLMLISNAMYIIMHNFNGYGKYAMGVARLLAGIAA
ncbi:hypothetical protein OSTOST_14599, partial [Ostertagia ostertagi]